MNEARGAGSGRFLTGGMAAALAVYALVVVSYFQPRVSNDGLSFLRFLQRLLGEADAGYAYQFGVAYWNLPFYLVARGVSSVGPDTLGDVPLEEVAFTGASVVAVGLLFYVGWRLLALAGLGGAPVALLLAIFGTPLFYSVLFSPWDTHSVDALFASMLAVLLVQASLEAVASPRRALAIGATLGLLVTVRYANVALVAGMLVVYLHRRRVGCAALAAASAAGVGGLLLLLPALRGIPYGVSANPEVDAEPGGVGDELLLDPLVPLKMLFTVQRGLFVWTPLTLLAAAGVVLLYRRQPRLRLALAALGTSALALLAFHALWGRYWVGGFGFSQRFLSGLFPLFLLGVAELLRRRRALALAALVPCVAWSAFLGLYHFYGYEGISGADGADRVLELYRSGEETPEEFLRSKVAVPVGRRWQAVGRALTPF